MNLVPHRVKVCVTLLSVLAAALFSTSAGAFFSTCAGLGQTDFSPGHPQAKDVLTFGILIYPLALVPAGYLVLTKTTYGPGNEITFDVVIAPPSATGMFPGYQTDSLSWANEIESFYTGTFGPLPVGQYSPTTSLRMYDSVTGFTSPCPAQPNATLIVYGDDGLSPVIEYYDSHLDHYFMTQSPVEIAALDAGLLSGWMRTGQSFLASLPGEGRGIPVVRYYGLPSAGLDTHFYMLNTGQIYELATQAQNWIVETQDAFNLDFPIAAGSPVGVCPTGEIPVYRLWNGRADSDHRYTTDPAIKAEMIAKGYIAEGYGPNAVMMCAFTR